MSQERYNRISDWVREKSYRYEMFMILYRVVPLLVAGTYGIMLLYGFFKMERNAWLRMILVPAATFLVVTVFRKIINEKRPYEVLDIHPLIHKSKQGESFPSRHMVSVTIIAMAGFYMNYPVGIWLAFLSVIVGILRPVAGVHYVRDILGAVCLSLLMGSVGFFLL